MWESAGRLTEVRVIFWSPFFDPSPLFSPRSGFAVISSSSRVPGVGEVAISERKGQDFQRFVMATGGHFRPGV
jgi:hypothetical protein